MPSRIPADRQAETGAYLAAWHERDDIRHLVQDGKRSGMFDDRLVAESVRLIRETWQPQPAPAWVTAVPSLRSGTLVPNLARRIADGLGLPYVDAIAQVRETDPQREQENSAHQCRNLDGAFEVARSLPAGPVLLVDDFVDSKWTFAILAYRLRDAGCGPVLPFALISTANRDD
jgi:ATP-dependent DNA helicase RecQ